MKKKVTFVSRPASSTTFGRTEKYNQLFVGFAGHGIAHVHVGNLWRRGREYVGFNRLTGNDVWAKSFKECRALLEKSLLEACRDIWCAEVLKDVEVA